MNLTDAEKSYLWRKVEFSAKKKMKDNKDDKDSKHGILYDLFNGSKKEFTTEEAKAMLGKLENRFKHALDGSRKPMKSEIFLSIMDKLPSGWSATTKYSNLEAKRKADKPKKANESVETESETENTNIKINESAKVLGFNDFISKLYKG